MTTAQRPSSPNAVSLRTEGLAENVLFGLVWAIGLEPGRSPDGFDERLSALLTRRKEELTEEEDATRRVARDILRFGRYKPTGRGKPASEYLVRAAREDSFPRISPPVDICNLISLEHLVSASIWDLDLAGADFIARRGREGEQYVFNASGQTIDLQDLLLLADASDTPIVNPVKDCHRTKTTSDSRNVAGVLYIPAAARIEPDTLMNQFRDLLAACGDSVETGLVLAGGTP